MPNYPAVCTATPAHGKAFCKEHCKFMEDHGYPSGLRPFLQKCGIGETGLFLILIENL